MKIKTLTIPAAGSWSRDCELIGLFYLKGLEIFYRKEEDNSYWKMRSERVLSYKVISEEFSTVSYLEELPSEGAFFEIVDSPWIHEFENERTSVLDLCKHYIFQFYDETLEIIAQNFIFEQLKGKPSFDLKEEFS